MDVGMNVQNRVGYIEYHFLKFALRTGALFCNSILWGSWFVNNAIPWIAHSLNPNVTSPQPQLIWVRFGASLLMSMVIFVVFVGGLIWLGGVRGRTKVQSKIWKYALEFSWDSTRFIWGFVWGNFFLGTPVNFLAVQITGSSNTAVFNPSTSDLGDEFTATFCATISIPVTFGLISTYKYYVAPEFNPIRMIRQGAQRFYDETKPPSFDNDLVQQQNYDALKGTSISDRVIENVGKLLRATTEVSNKSIEFFRFGFMFTNGYMWGGWLSFTFLPQMAYGHQALVGEKLLATLIYTVPITFFWLWFEVVVQEWEIRQPGSTKKRRSMAYLLLICLRNTSKFSVAYVMAMWWTFGFSYPLAYAMSGNDAGISIPSSINYVPVTFGAEAFGVTFFTVMFLTVLNDEHTIGLIAKVEGTVISNGRVPQWYLEFNNEDKPIVVTVADYWTLNYAFIFSWAFLWGWFFVGEAVPYLTDAWGYSAINQHVFWILASNTVVSVVLAAVYWMYLSLIRYTVNYDKLMFAEGSREDELAVTRLNYFSALEGPRNEFRESQARSKKALRKAELEARSFLNVGSVTGRVAPEEREDSNAEEEEEA